MRFTKNLEKGLFLTLLLTGAAGLTTGCVISATVNDDEDTEGRTSGNADDGNFTPGDPCASGSNNELDNNGQCVCQTGFDFFVAMRFHQA